MNEALMVYLGGGPAPGIDPHGQRERLEAAFPEDAGALLTQRMMVIDALSCDDRALESGDLNLIGASARDRIKKRFDWLEPIVVKNSEIISHTRCANR